eukprot:jgi/Ulvmu1/7686/UM038_0118.1
MRSYRQTLDLGLPRAARGARCTKRPGQVCRAVATETSTEQEVAEKRQVVSYNGVNFLVDEDPELKSSWGQRLIVASSSTAMALLMASGVSHGIDAPQACLCAFAGFIFADIGSGLYHFGVDNYGDKDTPVFGGQIAAFQGHHQRPWTITQREFCNNCSLTFKPAGVAAAFFLALSAIGVTASQWDVFAASAIFFIAMSQQFHAWSHMRPGQLPPGVKALQDANVIISRKAHGTHHRSPFNVNYCIVSGWCNPLLDAGMMLALERAIHRTWGVEPRGWSEPEAGWRELTPEEAAAADSAPRS